MKLLVAFLFGLSALAAQTPHSVALAWGAPTSGPPPTGYQIQRSMVSGGPYTTIGTVVGAATLTYNDISGAGNVLVEGVTYFYVVESVNGTAVSLASNESNGAKIPNAVPNAPTNVTAKPN